MEISPENYLEAADLVSKGFTKDEYITDGGNAFCTLGALGRTSHNYAYYYHQYSSTKARELQPLVKYLNRYPSFVFLRFMLGTQDGIAKWNDLPWRRQSTVVKVLRKVGEKQKIVTYDNTGFNLSVEVENLRKQVQELEVKIQKLQSENEHLWNRLVKSRELKTDQEQLQQLSDQLEAKQEELESV
jgi:hypothetical protein